MVDLFLYRLLFLNNYFSGRLFLFLGYLLYFFDPVIDQLRLIKTEGHLVDVVFYLEMVRLLFVLCDMFRLQLSILDIVVGAVLLVLGVVVQVDIISCHDRHILLVNIGHIVIYVHHPDL
jgi:hypothetical protein